nr:uncharacterized protein LOC117987550 isoform X1 [Maniola hyperantus]
MRRTLTCLLVLAIVTILNGRQFRCDYKYFNKADGWLKLHRIPANWREARLRCHLEGSKLASPLNTELAAAMRSVAQQNSLKCGVFTGIHSFFSRGDFHSIEGIPLSKIPHTWAEGEPDNLDNAESCMMMLDSGELADVNCSETLPYLCYKKTTRTALGDCGTVDSEYKLESRTGSCYKFHKTPRTWSRAYMACAAEGAHLAIINSDTEAQVQVPQDAAHVVPRVHGLRGRGRPPGHHQQLHGGSGTSSTRRRARGPARTWPARPRAPTWPSSTATRRLRYKFHKTPRTWSRAYMACAAEGAHLAIINSDTEAQVQVPQDAAHVVPRVHGLRGRGRPPGHHQQRHGGSGTSSTRRRARGPARTWPARPRAPTWPSSTATRRLRYKFHKTPRTWSRAYMACAAEGAHLAIINSDTEAQVQVPQDAAHVVPRVHGLRGRGRPPGHHQQRHGGSGTSSTRRRARGPARTWPARPRAPTWPSSTATRRLRYKFHKTPRTWSRAYMACAAEGAHLAIINSDTEAQVQVPQDAAHVVPRVHGLRGRGRPPGHHQQRHGGSGTSSTRRRARGPARTWPARPRAPTWPSSTATRRLRYKFHKTPRTWSRAYMACAAEGAHLAIINSDTEAQVIKEIFAKHPGGSMRGFFWKDVAFVGFHDWGEHGEFLTIEGQTLEEAGYAQFSGGEPNNATTGEYCGAVYRNGKFDDLWCENPYAFICEKNPDSLLCDDNDQQQ